MNNATDHEVAPGPIRTGCEPRQRPGHLALTGAIAALAATVATTATAALARAIGVDFEVPDGGETMPLSGIAVMTGLLSAVGIVIAAVNLRWSASPADTFVRVALALTAVSCVPPLLTGANSPTVISLLLLHLVAAAVMIPTLTRALRNQHTTRTEDPS